MRYFLVAGEASGDLHGANLIRALKEKDAEATFAFVGGDMMQAEAGTAPIVHYSEIALMGFLAVFARMRAIARAGRCMQEALRQFAPQRIVAIDSSGFNFQYLIPYAHRHFPNTPLIYYIVPKLWAWRERRIRILKRYNPTLLVILPFEEKYFARHGLDATYVGNPSVEAIGDYLASYGKEEFRKSFFAKHRELDLEKPLIALLPGSRSQELRDNLPLMLQTIRKHFPQYSPLIAGAPGRDLSDYAPYLHQHTEARVLFGETFHLLAASKLALVTSGTATLETALIGTPQVVCYRMNGSRFVNWAFKRFMKVPYFSLVNLIAEKPIVAELLGSQANEENLRNNIEELLRKPAEITQGYNLVREILGTQKASHNAAQVVIQTESNT